MPGMIASRVSEFFARGNAVLASLIRAVDGVEPLRIGGELGPFLSIERIGDGVHVSLGVNFSRPQGGDEEFWWPVGKRLRLGAVMGEQQNTIPLGGTFGSIYGPVEVQGFGSVYAAPR